MIYIVAGHGAGDPGAVANRTTEADVAERITSQLIKKYPKQLARVPSGKTLRNKIRWINSNLSSNDKLISLHMNAAGSDQAHGAEIYYYGGDEQSKDEATRMLGVYCKETGLWNRGAKTDFSTRHGRLGIVRDTKPWAFLIELSFITNREDLNIALSKGADGVAEMLQLNNIIMEEKKLAEWEQQAMEFGEDTGVMTGGRPHEAITRVEVAEVSRKLYAYILNKFHS